MHEMGNGQTIQFFVKGTPKAQPRPRAFARRMPSGQVIARVYDDSSAEGWKSCIAFHANEHVPDVPLEGPVRVDAVFLFPRPQYLLKKKCPDGPIRHTAKPDRDNLDKALLDVLKTLGFFRDDSQVCDGGIKKFYVAREGISGAHVRIMQITDDDKQAAPEEMVSSAPLFEPMQQEIGHAKSR